MNSYNPKRTTHMSLFKTHARIHENAGTYIYKQMQAYTQTQNRNTYEHTYPLGELGVVRSVANCCVRRVVSLLLLASARTYTLRHIAILVNDVDL